MTESEVLSLKQVGRYQTMNALLEGRLHNAQAAQALRLSVRQVQRLKQRVRVQGARGVVHGNVGRAPHNQTPQRIKERVIQLATQDYAHFNFSHLADQLSEAHHLSFSDEILRRWLRPLGHGRPLRRGKPHRRRRERRPREGELLFLDGSPHRWFGDGHPRVCLLLCSDDATGKPLYGKFQPQEDRDGCFEVCYHVMNQYGLPGGFYLDRASQFTTTRHEGVRARQSDLELTHFESAMQALSVALLFAHSPQARGRAERLNGSFQDRLLAELQLHHLTDCHTATRYLNSSFIPRYAKRFAQLPTDPHPAWRPLPKDLDLRHLLCAKFLRAIAQDNTVMFQSDLYQLIPPRRLYRVQAQCWFDGSVHFWHSAYGFLKAKRLTHKHKKSFLSPLPAGQ